MKKILISKVFIVLFCALVSRIKTENSTQVSFSIVESNITRSREHFEINSNLGLTRDNGYGTFSLVFEKGESNTCDEEFLIEITECMKMYNDCYTNGEIIEYHQGSIASNGFETNEIYVTVNFFTGKINMFQVNVQKANKTSSSKCNLNLTVSFGKLKYNENKDLYNLLGYVIPIPVGFMIGLIISIMYFIFKFVLSYDHVKRSDKLDKDWIGEKCPICNHDMHHYYTGGEERCEVLVENKHGDCVCSVECKVQGCHKNKKCPNEGCRCKKCNCKLCSPKIKCGCTGCRCKICKKKTFTVRQLYVCSILGGWGSNGSLAIIEIIVLFGLFLGSVVVGVLTLLSFTRELSIYSSPGLLSYIFFFFLGSIVLNWIMLFLQITSVCFLVCILKPKRTRADNITVPLNIGNLTKNWKMINEEENNQEKATKNIDNEINLEMDSFSDDPNKK